ncbi:MAG: hypothetical protein JWL77_6955, partial [Chthonomonadaceae bacterium]|nr:hypothetical protein [Chthonomonadaceae bacterium]
MATHDPRREVEKLRAHLASHDKPIAFLVGAGSSCAVRDPTGEPLVPAMAALGALCESAVKALGADYVAAWDRIVDDVNATRPSCNIEEILSNVRRKISALGPGDSLAGLDRDRLRKVEEAIQATIARAARPDEARIPTSLPHHALAR